MVSLRELTEARGNQGREEGGEGVISVEPITMIVPPELQDVPETTTPDSGASSSARDNSGEHPTASSSSSSTEETPSREEGMGDVVCSVSDRLAIGEWEGRTIAGRLSNLRKAPKDLPAGFRFEAALHHEVADCAPSISGYKKLEEMVRAYHIPRTILLRTGGQNERACTVSQTGWILVYVDHRDAGLRFPLPGLIFDLLADYELALAQLTPNSIRFIIGFMLLCAKLEVPAKVIVFRSLFQCRLCPNSRGAKWYYLSGREKSQLFKNVRNKVARWKRQFIFVRDTQAERISYDLTAWLSEWRTQNAHVNYPQLLPRDVDLKNQLLEYAKRENLIDLEALVTSEQLALFGRNEQHTRASTSASPGLTRSRSGSTSQRQTRFDERPPPGPQSRSSSHRGSSSASRPRAEHRAEAAASSARRRAREEMDSEDEVPLLRRRMTGGTEPAQASQTAAARSSSAPSATVRAADPASASTSTSCPRIAYPDGFSYVRAECQPAMVQGMHSFVRPADRQWAKAFVQQHGSQVAMIKLMDAFSYAVALYESEQGARTQNSELSSKCKQLTAEKASLVDDVNRLQGSEMANRAAAAESRANELANRNNELEEELEQARAEKESGIQAAKEEAVRVEERAKKAEAERDRTLYELNSFKSQVAEVARNLNAAEEALNELKATHRRSISMARAQGAKWLVGSAAFQDAMAVASANVTTEIYNEIRGKVLHHRPDFPIRELVFFDEEELDEQGRAHLATIVLEDGEDPTGLPSFDAWVEGVPVAEQEPSSTPPNSQPAEVPASAPINAPVLEPAARSPPARSPIAAAADASMPVDLTDD
ncbi:hypothetical protein SLEP1_g35341 [Rubroshorea leprosula]|uniref:Transposase (putative) gypsy type domain-containing protein n=1 Tax=Rubroshorea leprosula TaxID=152421 RepID=A0AAV5KMU4_9ROSI|nr:hypothetical protein SLEP1_g35341 [Rubroshorea leprosula]